MYISLGNLSKPFCLGEHKLTNMKSKNNHSTKSHIQEVLDKNV